MGELFATEGTKDGHLTPWLCRFIKVANETMCRPIRALTEARGYALQKHVYVQH